MDVDGRGGAWESVEERVWKGVEWKERHAGKSEQAAVRAGITGKGGPIILGLLGIIGDYWSLLGCLEFV